MAFIVIEGDNGTGKDTLAMKLAESGYAIISYFPKVKEQEHFARNSNDTTQAFLNYNMYCGKLAQSVEEIGIIIRYWVSTLAASYADHIYEYDKVMQLTDIMKKSMAEPLVIIRIWVENETRLNRIAIRNTKNPDLSDDITIARAQRYEWISKEILNRSGYCWREFNNSSVDLDELSKEVLDFIKGDRLVEKKVN